MTNQFYVYGLVDPRDGTTFYIGKGRGARIKQHALEVAKGRGDANHTKCRRILEIMQAGQSVREEVIKAGLSEHEAYSLERELIRKHKPRLTNINPGNRDSVQIRKDHANLLLSRLKTFEHWIATVPQEFMACTVQYGGPRKFYEKFRATLEHEAVQPSPLTVGVMHGPR